MPRTVGGAPGTRARSRTQVRDDPAEVLASALEILVLVVARARRREEHDVAGLCHGRRTRDRLLERAGALVRDVRTVERARELVRRLADQIDRRRSAAGVAGEVVEALALERAAEDEPQRRVVGGDPAP